ncbi:MAG: hypothetical protein HC929_15210 [Leptolyngbyaceae cyanobacterium SM2_5_2]|nr:hypothetical protein [Leptolyngbyaceae cyanobacterium SM2_5_2]
MTTDFRSSIQPQPTQPTNGHGAHLNNGTGPLSSAETQTSSHADGSQEAVRPSRWLSLAPPSPLGCSGLAT